MRTSILVVHRGYADVYSLKNQENHQEQLPSTPQAHERAQAQVAEALLSTHG